MERLSGVFTFRIMKSAKLPYMALHLVPGVVRAVTSKYASAAMLLTHIAHLYFKMTYVHACKATWNVTLSVYGNFIRHAVYET